MAYSLEQIAAALGARVLGAADLLIDGLAEPAEAGPNDLALASNPKYAEQLAKGQAQAALLWDGADWRGLGLMGAICVTRPRFAMATTTRLYDAAWRAGQGVHPTAVIDPSAQVPEDAVIGPLCVIGADVVLGENTVLGAHVSIGAGSRLGAGAFLRDGVRIAHGVTAGENLVVHHGAAIGGDGFSFVTPEVSAAETVRETLGAQTESDAQTWSRIHSLGGVEIGDGVEIGANSSIDRGTIRATRIGSGTKIDSLVQVGHNVEIGRDCLLCGHVAIGGSTRIGDNAILGGKTGVVDNIFVGDRVVTGAGTLLMSNVPDGRVMLGYPATQMKAHLDSYRALRRLPKLASDVAALKKTVPNARGND